MRTDGSVECWGYDGDGQATPPGGEFVSVSAGDFHTCGVRTDGSVECWYYEAFGEASQPVQSVADVMARVSPSVVLIVTSDGSGSGVIYEVDAHTNVARILTNCHVIEGASNVKAVISGAEYPATRSSCGADVDLAVIEVCCDSLFTASEFANFSDVSIGSQVYALGYPLEVDSIRVTAGIISGLL